MKAILVSIISIVAAQTNSTESTKPFTRDKCRALALRGGGTKGAYEVGALKAITDMLDPSEYAYDVVEGVSVGGLNGGMFATFEIGDEKRAVKSMNDAWLNNPVTSLWNNWPFLGPVEALWKSSIFGVDGLEKMIRE